MDIVKSFKMYSSAYRPLFLIEWFATDRQKDCNSHYSKKIWQTAEALNYDVWNWKSNQQFATCHDAIKYFNSVERIARAKSILLCGNNENEEDLCDLVLAPKEMKTTERSKLCPEPLTSDQVKQLMISQKA